MRFLSKVLLAIIFVAVVSMLFAYGMERKHKGFNDDDDVVLKGCD